MLANRLTPSSNDQGLDSDALTGTTSTSSLALKFKSLGIENDDLKALVRLLKRQPRILAGVDIIKAQLVGHSTVLLAGVACLYRRLEDGSRQIYSFQYPGDFCDLFRYILPERDEEMAVQALTECSVATIEYGDLEQLLAQHARLGLGLWRTTILEASILRERLSNARRGSALQSVANLLCEQLARRAVIGPQNPIHLDAHSEPQPDLYLAQPPRSRYRSGHPSNCSCCTGQSDPGCRR